MGGLTVSLRFFIAMQELYLMNCTCYVVTSPSILCALWKPDLMTLCWTCNKLIISSYFLVRLNSNRHSVVVIRDDLSYNVTLSSWQHGIAIAQW